MKEAQVLHQEAMVLAEQASLSRVRGDQDNAARWIHAAFEKEKDAALKVAQDFSLEPTRSVLLRSAAALALECRELREAERLVSMALAGHPPEEIADELREILEDIYRDMDWVFFRPRAQQAQ